MLRGPNGNRLEKAEKSYYIKFAFPSILNTFLKKCRLTLKTLHYL